MVARRRFKRSACVSAAKVEIYTKWGCPYCVRAKALLDGKGVSYTEYDITITDCP